ncbi:MAG TPA: DUF1553 domain-containing protein [Planctomicrobium sp.]|nr:DUF1553 domain-containing protein [Planctomicrobium sp.]
MRTSFCRFNVRLTLLLIPAWLSLLPYLVNADQNNDLITGVATIFEQHCLRCHSSEDRRGGFSLSTQAEFFKGGESGEVVARKNPDESLLIDMITGDSPSMPAEGEPLTPAQINIIKQWIASGAEWPESLVLQERIPGGLDWWSFQPVVRPVIPDVKNKDWGRNEIDRFILSQLEKQNLSPSSEADRRTLIRRLSFDLLGLPPSYEEVNKFIEDTDPLAYEKLVDRLLASPRYGERWGRHWLDIAHYADTHGFERDQRRDHAWRYRDYVIRSLNKDKPYNEFLQEQIAGDVLHPEDPDAIVATGFLAAGPWDFVGQVETGSPALKRAARADDLDDIVTQVVTASIGLTINCARCHDHKLDPISQQEYYQLWSLFAGVKRGNRESNPVESRRLAEFKESLQKEQAEIRTRLAQLRGPRFNLANIVAGGNEQSGGGIDPISGAAIQSERGFLTGVQLNHFASSVVKFVDGVVIPDASEEGTQISTTGLRIRNVPKTSGQVWDAIRSGPLKSQFSTRLGEVDFAAKEHSLLSMHANSAITFDLDEMRAAGDLEDLTLSASLGYFGQTAQAGASVFVYVDGILQFERIGLGRNDGLVPIQLNLLRTARFLTLMATDNGNGISHDQIGFGNAWLAPTHPVGLDDGQQAKLQKLDERLTQIDRQLKELPTPEQYYGVISEAIPAVHRLHRGDAEQPREEVQPGALSCIAGISPDLVIEGNREGDRRRAFAEWIIHSDHPLTRRVLVNRLWHHHFGKGIVDTPSDFGYGGGRPSHPELLDYLAEEFLNQGWSLKKMHRLLCTSATYRQRSTIDNPHAQQVDSENRLFWRMTPRRLDAESIWDTTLTVAGNLNLEMYGPGFRDFHYTEAYAPVYRYTTPDSPDQWRRSIYRFIVRSTPHQFMGTLDCPNPANLTPVRNVTTTALQSLTMLNNEFLLKQSVYFAERVTRERESSQEQIQLAFRYAFGRDPTPQEAGAALELLKSTSLTQLCRMLLNANEFVYID